MARTDLPEGTVTFLFTDIQGSTELLKQLGASYATLLADQREILRAAFEHWDGREIDTQGDAFFASFPRATQAVAAVVEIQRALAAHDWPSGVEVYVRMGLHTGEPWLVEEGYVGMDVHRAARIAHVGHGGQALLSETTTPLVVDELPEGVELLDLGHHRLKDLRRPEHIHQLVIDGLKSDFFPLNSLEVVSAPGIPLAGELNLAELRLHLPAAELPESLVEGYEETPQQPFIGRQAELDRLDKMLDQATKGHGQLAFVAGEAGSGKTALLHGFGRHAQVNNPDILLAMGECNAFSGQGDPYLPFRDLLRMLTGDIHSRLTTHTINLEQARRLWSALPVTVPSLIEHGHDLLDVFVSIRELAARLQLARQSGDGWAMWQQELDKRVRAASDGPERSQLFDQFTVVLETISRQAPLVLLIDDMQWADADSISLLFHLARRLEGTTILILIAYRPEEIRRGREVEPNPLEMALGEFKRQFGDVWIDLDARREIQGSQFIEDLLDSEPNRLSSEFRQALFQHTGGHPLFTVELLRILQEGGSLVKDEDGMWCESPELSWDVLPARVEGVIEARLARLEAGSLDLLRAASLIGVDFSLHVLASVTGRPMTKLARHLGENLGRQHQLVQELGPRQIGSQRDYHFRFRHALFQQHLYRQVGEAERYLLHADIGEALENLYADGIDEVTVQLAYHFSQAGEVEKAIKYLLLAGDRARGLYAHQEAIEHYRRALVFLKDKGEYERAARTLMKLALTYHTAFDFSRSREAYREGFALWKRVSTSEPHHLPPPPHPLRVSGSNPLSFDPSIAGDSYSAVISNQLFSGLIVLGPELEVLPDVAQSWDVLEGGRKYIFHLRDDVVWSDGYSLTANDFEFAWKRVLDPASGSSSINLFDDVKGAQAFHQGKIAETDFVGVRSLDSHTLIVELDEPTGYFLYLLANPATYPVPRHTVESFGNRWTEVQHLVTNGPFRLENWNSGVSLTLARNPKYHGHFNGNLQKVDYLIDREPSDLMELYEKDELDLISLSGMDWFPVREHDAVRRRYAEDYISIPELSTAYFGFDLSRPPFDDQRVRRAFALATDKEWWADEDQRGLYFPATGGFIPPGMPGHSSNIGMQYDPEKARKLLAEAGYPNGESFPSICMEWPVPGQGYAPLRQRWQAILGIEIESSTMDWGAYLDRFRRGQLSNIFFMGWVADYPDPDNFLRVGLNSSDIGWKSEEYIRLVEKARRITDQRVRMKLYRQADRMLVEEVVILPLAYLRSHMLLKPWVKKYPITPIGLWSWKDVIIDPH